MFVWFVLVIYQRYIWNWLDILSLVPYSGICKGKHNERETMTRKDYQAVAAAILAERAAVEVRECDSMKLDLQWQATAMIAHRLAVVFAADNARFNRVKFLHACGVEA